MSQLRSGGSFAVQMPSNWLQPSHQLLYETCTQGSSCTNTYENHHTSIICMSFLTDCVIEKWSDGVQRYIKEKPITMASMDEYYRILRPLSSYTDVWLTEYMHVIPSNSNTTVANSTSHPVCCICLYSTPLHRQPNSYLLFVSVCFMCRYTNG
jgi:trans-aconitate methyltransferase